MKFIKVVSLVLISCFCNVSLSYAVEDMDWTFKLEPVHEAGPDTPVVGKRWTLWSVRGDIIFNIHLDAQPDMMRGNWHGDIRALERFYSKVYYTVEGGNKIYLKINDAKAVGPDSEYGRWKNGLATANVQVLQFDFTIDKLMLLKNAKTLIVNYASFEAPDVTHDIVFPMGSFAQRLLELEKSIRAEGGAAYLVTTTVKENTPIQDLPPSIRNPLEASLADVSTELSVPISELTALTITQIKARIKDKKTAAQDAAIAAKRAEHQLIYDQQPDWIDLNVCPKPDVSFCANVGRSGYEIDRMFNDEYDYGKIVGVVWRSKGSIVHIYGGAIKLDIEPEIHRASTAQYYYVTKNDKNRLEIRPAKSMRTR